MIFHQPAGGHIPSALIADAARLNSDGWGLMAVMPDGRVIVERHRQVDVAAIAQRLAQLAGAELCLHLRQRTRGACSLDNTHPIRIDDRFEMMHNGTVRLPSDAHGRSDSWQLANTLLAPLLATQPQLAGEAAFVALVEAGLTPRNRLVLLDRDQRRFVFFNRAHGTDVDGLWISGWHWIERARAQAAAPRSRPPKASVRRVA
ncbi:hypothetical protein [Oleiagrimonas sp. C23AA]|uniref:hypothetical protein n=1 Tax=Oleiagrimonas sp. C23AA TaxID=2719047 RepID=UPI00141F34F7|nr:hypothetical protein [Oleiagrimonas sp. C23AA]NII10648.1 hypothetical protein [Oleiagrimonas sp. C23AA]